MSLSNLPLPSFSLVLTAHQDFIFGSPVASDTIINEAPATPAIDMMRTVDYRDVDPLEYQHFSFVMRAQQHVGDAPAAPIKRRKRVRNPCTAIVTFFAHAIHKMILLRSDHVPLRQRRHL